MVVLVALFVFRSDIAGVFRRLKKVETSAAKILFNEEIKEFEQDAEFIPVAEDEFSSEWIKEMNAIAKLNPRAAIIEAWTSIEVTCLEIGMFQGASIDAEKYIELADKTVNALNASIKRMEPTVKTPVFESEV